MTTNHTTPDTEDPGYEVIEFTTPKARTQERITTPVILCGEDMVAQRPKDAVLFFVQSAIADVANEADRAMAMLQILDASFNAADRYRIFRRACDRDDPVTAGSIYDMIDQLLERWAPESKIPASAAITVTPVPDAAPAADPVTVVNNDLDLNLRCHPPKDLVLHITASSLATGVNQGQQAWCVMLFLDATLTPADAMILERRLRSSHDPLDLEALLAIIHSLMARWYPEADPERSGNRKQRRAKAATSRKKGPGSKTTRKPSEGEEG